MLIACSAACSRRAISGWRSISTTSLTAGRTSGSIRRWPHPLPGLLQTAEYARSLIVTEGAGVWDDPDEIERMVEIRMRRQARLDDERPLQVYAVIWEAALRQLIGSSETMRAQLQHLLEVTKLPNVRLQVLPFRAGGHPCITGPFTIVSFAETEAVDVVHADTIVSTVWVENEAESAAYSAFFDRTARLSLAQHDSALLIDTIRQEM
ncbi:DUF5753 domain-containing protein [Streptomyces pseudoechinosporeus]